MDSTLPSESLKCLAVFEQVLPCQHTQAKTTVTMIMAKHCPQFSGQNTQSQQDSRAGVIPGSPPLWPWWLQPATRSNASP